MADAPNLGAPPKTLTRAQVLAKLKPHDGVVEVAGLGPLRAQSLTIEDMSSILALAQNGGDKPDPVLATCYAIARTFPDVFKDADVVAIRHAQPDVFLALTVSMNEVNGDVMSRGKEAANVPLSFREGAGVGGGVQRRARSGKKR